MSWEEFFNTTTTTFPFGVLTGFIIGLSTISALGIGLIVTGLYAFYHEWSLTKGVIP